MTPTWSDFIGAFSLFRDPILAGMAAGLALGSLSVFIVLRRMVFLSATLAQSAGLGVALAFWVEIFFDGHINAMWGAGALSLVAGWLLSGDPEKYRTTRESIMALVYIAASAGAVIIGSRISQEAHDIHAILFGSAVLVRPEDLYLLLGGAAATLVFVVLAWRGLMFANFDPIGAAVQGLPTRALEAGLLTLIVFMVAVATRALGALPVFAFSTLPAIAALGLTRTLSIAVPLAAVIGAASGGGGYVLAFFYDLPVGATETAVVAVLAAIGLVIRRLRS